MTRSLSMKVLNQRASSPSSSRLRTSSRRVRSPSPSAMSRSSPTVWPRGRVMARARTKLRTNAKAMAPSTALTTHHSMAAARASSVLAWLSACSIRIAVSSLRILRAFSNFTGPSLMERSMASRRDDGVSSDRILTVSRDTCAQSRTPWPESRAPAARSWCPPAMSAWSLLRLLLELRQADADHQRAGRSTVHEHRHRDLDLVGLRGLIELGMALPRAARRERDVELGHTLVDIPGRLFRERHLLALRRTQERLGDEPAAGLHLGLQEFAGTVRLEGPHDRIASPKALQRGVVHSGQRSLGVLVRDGLDDHGVGRPAGDDLLLPVELGLDGRRDLERRIGGRGRHHDRDPDNETDAHIDARHRPPPLPDPHRLNATNPGTSRISATPPSLRIVAPATPATF